MQTVSWTKSKASDPIGTLKSMSPAFVISFVSVGSNVVSTSYQHGYSRLQGAKKGMEEYVSFFYNRFMMGLTSKAKKEQ